MKYSKIFQYAYLVFAGLFAYNAVTKYANEGIVDYPSILLAAVAVFMYFFGGKFRKKFENKDNSK